MATTQLDIIRQQAEAAARNAVSRATGELRRDTSLVSQASRMTGKAFQAGEEALRSQMGRSRRYGAVPGETVATPPPPPCPAADGYVRRSPVQPVHEAVNYRRGLILRGVGAAVAVVAVCTAVWLLLRLNVFGW